MKRRLVPFLLLIIAVKIAFSQQILQEPIGSQVAACELLQHPEQYNGHLVVTRLILGNSLHSVVMFAPECNVQSAPAIQPTFDPPYRVDSKEDKTLRKSLGRYGAIWATVEGTFISSGGPFGPLGRPLKMEIHSIRNLEKIPPADRQRWNIGTGKSAEH